MKTVFKFKSTGQMFKSLNKRFKPFPDRIHADSFKYTRYNKSEFIGCYDYKTFAEIFKSNIDGTIRIECAPKFPHHFRYHKCVFSITIDVSRREYRISIISRLILSSDGSVYERYAWIPR